jgi:hypothetical protein
MKASEIREAVASGQIPNVPPSILARALGRSPNRGRPRTAPESCRVRIRVPEAERLWLEVLGSSPLEYVLYNLLAAEPHVDFALPPGDPSARDELSTIDVCLPLDVLARLRPGLVRTNLSLGSFLGLLWAWGQGTLPKSLTRRLRDALAPL